MSLKRCHSLCRLAVLLVLLIPLARCVRSDSRRYPIAPAFNNSTTPPSLAVPTPTANGTGFAHANKCWSSWDAWSTSSKNCRLTTTNTETVAFTEERSSVIYETYKLCDGHPRANATAGESTSRTTASESGTAWATFTEVLPPSGIPESTITTLVTSRATLYETACATSLASPSCSIGVEDCPSLFSAWTAGGFKRGRPSCTFAMSADPCDDCAIYIPTVQLLYFPVSMTGDFCGDYSTATQTYLANASTPSTVVVSGHTLTSGSAYLSYAGMTARAGQNRQCGTPLPAGILGLPSSRLSTYRGHAAAMPIASLPPHSLNFADLAPNPVPWDAWISQETCVTNQETATCQTITQAAYRPWIVYPREFWEMEPKWSKCGSDVFGIMDPPSALPLAQEMPMPTMPTVTGDDGAANTERPLPSAVAPKPTTEPTGTRDATQDAQASSGPRAPDPSKTGNQDPAATAPPVSSRSNGQSEPLSSATAPGSSGTTTRDPPPEQPTPTFQPTRITASFTFEPVPASQAHPSSQNIVLPTQSAEEPGPQGSPADPDNEPASDSPQQTTRSITHDAGSPPLTAPGLSILASALAPRISSAEPSLASRMSSVLDSANSILHPDASPTSDTDTIVSDPLSQPMPSSSRTTSPIVVTLDDEPHTLRRTGGGYLVLGSRTLDPGERTTISGVPVAVYSSAILVGSTFVPLPQPQSPSAGAGTSEVESPIFGGDVLPSIVEPSGTGASSAELPGLTTAPATATVSTGNPGGGGGGVENGGQPGVTTIGVENGAARNWRSAYTVCMVLAVGMILA